MEKLIICPHISINEKYLQNFDLKNFVSLTQLIQLLFWPLKFIKVYIVVT